jgi:hypothetical protein
VTPGDSVQQRCLTCSDEAVEAVVVSVAGREAVVKAVVTPVVTAAATVADDAAGRSAQVTSRHLPGPERLERVAIDLVPDARPGDTLLCHAGIALERVA